jgi:hypothetical protein
MLRRAGVRADAAGRLIADDNNGVRSTEVDSAALWTSDTVSVFLSHTSNHRIRVSTIAQ